MYVITYPCRDLSWTMFVKRAPCGMCCCGWTNCPPEWWSIARFVVLNDNLVLYIIYIYICNVNVTKISMEPTELVFSIQKHVKCKCLALIAQMVRSGMNLKWGRVFPRSRYFLSQKLRHFHKNTRSCVENECCCPCTVNMTNVNFSTHAHAHAHAHTNAHTNAHTHAHTTHTHI